VECCGRRRSQQRGRRRRRVWRRAKLSNVAEDSRAASARAALAALANQQGRQREAARIVRRLLNSPSIAGERAPAPEPIISSNGRGNVAGRLEGPASGVGALSAHADGRLDLAVCLHVAGQSPLAIFDRTR